MKKHEIKNILLFLRSAAIIFLIMLFSISVIGTFAWSDTQQHKTNVMKSFNLPVSVTLYKFEKDVSGNSTEKPIPNIEFYLYTADDLQIGGKYITDTAGKITIPDLEFGDYYFLEVTPNYGYTYDKDENGEDIKKYPFTISEKTPIIKVLAYNQCIPGSLIITKTVKNADNSLLTKEQLDTEFEFTVSFSDNGTYKYSVDNAPLKPLVSGEKLYLKHGQKAVFENIPVKILYTIIETPVENYVISSENHQGNIIESGQTASFINTYYKRLGKLTVSKKISGEEIPDINKIFEFTVSFSELGKYTYKINNGEEKILSADGKIYLKHNESAVFSELPIGLEYSVEEKDDPDYTALKKIVSGAIIENGSKAEFVNNNNLSGGKGKLIITKNVPNAINDQQEFEFIIEFSESDYEYFYSINNGDLNPFNNGDTISLRSGDYIELDNIPEGFKYTITEKPIQGYISSIKIIEGTIAGEDISKADFVNEKHGETSLIVKKVVDSEFPLKDKEFNFILFVDEKETEFTLKNGETSQVFILPYGSEYRVEEKDSSKEDFIQSSIINGAGIANGGTVEVIQTNTYIGPITIEFSGTKTWTLPEENDNIIIPSEITLILKNGDKIADVITVIPDDKGNWNYTITAPKYQDDGKTPIEYTIEEKLIDNYKPVYKSTDEGFDIENIYISPLTVDGISPIKKQIIGDVPKKDEKFFFVMTAQDNAPMPKNAENGESIVSIIGEGETNFGKITYNQAGSYTYLSSERLGENSEYIYDKTIYILQVKIIEKDNKLIVQSQILTKQYENETKEMACFINTYNKTIEPEPDEIIINGTKTWVHGTNPEKNWPQSIIIIIKDGDFIVKQKTITKEDNWQWSFKLPKYDDNNREIQYSIEETDVPKYKKTIKGYDVLNTFVEPHVSSGEKEDPLETGDIRLIWPWMLCLLASLSIILFICITNKNEKRYKKN